MGMLEKLYQDVWAQVYAATWAGLRDAARDGLINPEMRPVLARTEAERAAASALASRDHGKQDLAVEWFMTHAGSHESVDRTAMLVPDSGPAACDYELTVDGDKTMGDMTRVDVAAEIAREAMKALDRPSTAVAQLRELSEWLSRDGKDDVSGLAADLAESIAITYGVE